MSLGNTYDSPSGIKLVLHIAVCIGNIDRSALCSCLFVRISQAPQHRSHQAVFICVLIWQEATTESKSECTESKTWIGSVSSRSLTARRERELAVRSRLVFDMARRIWRELGVAIIAIEPYSLMIVSFILRYHHLMIASCFKMTSSRFTNGPNHGS